MSGRGWRRARSVLRCSRLAARAQIASLKIVEIRRNSSV
jgi:hypothetical protein